MSSIWNSLTNKGSQNTNTPAPTADYTASNQTAQGINNNNAATFGASNAYNTGVLNGTQQSAASIAGQTASQDLAAQQLAGASATRGGMGGGNALKNAAAGTATGQAGIAANVAQGTAAEKATAAGGLAQAGAAQGQIGLGEQGLQQQQAMTPAELQLANRSQNLQANAQNVQEGNGAINAGASLAGSLFGSDENLKTDVSYADADVKGGAEFLEPGPGKSTGGRGPARATLREVPYGTGLVLKNQLTGALGEVVTRPLSRQQQHIVEDEHGAGPLDADDPRRAHSQMSDGDVGQDPLAHRAYNDGDMFSAFGKAFGQIPSFTGGGSPAPQQSGSGSGGGANGLMSAIGGKMSGAMGGGDSGGGDTGDFGGGDSGGGGADLADGDIFGSGAGLMGKGASPGYGLASGGGMNVGGNTALVNAGQAAVGGSSGGAKGPGGPQYADGDVNDRFDIQPKSHSPGFATPGKRGSVPQGARGGPQMRGGDISKTYNDLNVDGPVDASAGIPDTDSPSDLSYVPGKPHEDTTMSDVRSGLMRSMDAPQRQVDTAKAYGTGLQPGPNPIASKAGGGEFGQQDFYGTVDPEQQRANEEDTIYAKTGFGPDHSNASVKPTYSGDQWDRANSLFPSNEPQDQSRIPKWQAPGDGTMSSGTEDYSKGWDTSHDVIDGSGRHGDYTQPSRSGLPSENGSGFRPYAGQSGGKEPSWLQKSARSFLGEPLARPGEKGYQPGQSGGSGGSGKSSNPLGNGLSSASESLGKDKHGDDWRDYVSPPRITSDRNAKTDVEDADFLGRGQVVSGHVSSDARNKANITQSVGEPRFAMAGGDVGRNPYAYPSHEPGRINPMPPQQPKASIEDYPLGQDEAEDDYRIEPDDLAPSFYDRASYARPRQVHHDGDIMPPPYDNTVSGAATMADGDVGGHSYMRHHINPVRAGTEDSSWFSLASHKNSPSTLGLHGEAPPSQHAEPERPADGPAPSWNRNDTYDAISPGPPEPMANPYADGDVSTGNKHDEEQPTIVRDPTEKGVAHTDAYGEPLVESHGGAPSDTRRFYGYQLQNSETYDRIPLRYWGESGPTSEPPRTAPDADTKPLMDLRMHNFRAPDPQPWHNPHDPTNDPGASAWERAHFADADIGGNKKFATQFPPDKMNTPPVVGFADIDRDHNPDLDSSTGGDFTERGISGFGDKYGHGKNHYQGGAGPEQRNESLPSGAEPRPTRLADDGGRSVTGTNELGHPPHGASPRQVEHPELGGNASGSGSVLMSDKTKKTDVKKVDNERPKDTTDTGDKGGPEQREAKRGDKESERETHNSQHTPSRKDNNSGANPSQKTKVDAYGAKQSAGPGRRWFDKYFKDQNSHIPEGRDGFRGRVGADNAMGHTTYGNMPFAKQYSDADLAATDGDQSSYLGGQPGPMGANVGMPHPMQSPAVRNPPFSDADVYNGPDTGPQRGPDPNYDMVRPLHYRDEPGFEHGLPDYAFVSARERPYEQAGRDMNQMQPGAPMREPGHFEIGRDYPSADEDSSVMYAEHGYDVPPPSLQERAAAAPGVARGVRDQAMAGMKPGPGLAAAQRDQNQSPAMDHLAKKQAGRR